MKGRVLLASLALFSLMPLVSADNIMGLWFLFGGLFVLSILVPWLVGCVVKVILYASYLKVVKNPLRCLKRLLAAEFISLPLTVLAVFLLFFLNAKLGWGLNLYMDMWGTVPPAILVSFFMDMIFIVGFRRDMSARKALFLCVWVNFFGILALLALPSLTTPAGWAHLYNDRNICNEISNFDERYRCMKTVDYNDPMPTTDICAGLTNTSVKHTCYWNIFYSNRDPALCDRISRTADSNTSDDCYYLTNINVKQPLCDRIVDEKRRDECYRYIAGSYKNASICDRITNNKSQYECYSSIFFYGLDTTACKTDEDCVVVDSVLLACISGHETINRRYLREWAWIASRKNNCTAINTPANRTYYYEENVSCKNRKCELTYELRCVEGYEKWRGSCLPAEEVDGLRQGAGENATEKAAWSSGNTTAVDMQASMRFHMCQSQNGSSRCRCFYSLAVRNRHMEWCADLENMSCEGVGSLVYNKDYCIFTLADDESDCGKIAGQTLADLCRRKV